jgi:hypothetical protein
MKGQVGDGWTDASMGEEINCKPSDLQLGLNAVQAKCKQKRYFVPTDVVGVREDG